MSDISNLKNQVEQEMIDVKQIDGSVDPIWQSKLDKFFKESKKFISDLDNEKKYNNLLIDSNLEKCKDYYTYC